ncbi:RagB/SusD family nutrient uptake outer membrane protein [Sunxiuqinia elliptica]|uniref:Putative outer membrane starch-binding protein n=1 Tax=Sunxiuqinia elliptica TaxID=655355 RepID=A0A4R6HCL8_9BACT|nr:RagB/SusD family nutrient uptake outer membrane protein [Sunxiuqinia elliptica]TDO05531.1 putative outer membrane starch-binding protein [Sunxiuqinia elliptica]TDO65075.1 putative outer membrane starch-binding protein [Sunxiuqinia elliptica]
MRLTIVTMILIMGLSGCNDLLDLKPKSKISQADYFQTETDLQLFSNPFYNNLLDKSPYDLQSDLYVCQNLSDEMLGGTKRTIPASGGGWSWTDLRRMNTLIAYADQCEDENAVIKYTALTRFFRAFFYFEKIKRFGDVPWYEVELGSADEELYNARDSRELVMTRMIEDIDYAIANLPDKVEETSSPYRVNKYAAMALKAQFCLYEGTYRKYHSLSLEGHDYKYYLEQSATAAQKLMNDGAYSLYSTNHPESDYLTLFAQENADPNEYILAIKFDYGLSIYHNATAHTLVPTQGRPGLTRKMVNTYLKKDGTAFTNQSGWQEMSFIEEMQDRDPRLAQSIRTPGYTRIGQTTVLAPDLSTSVTGYQPIKFVQDPNASGGNVDRNSRSTCDLPVYRYAEVLLNYAEAKAELGSLTQADLDESINLIRQRAGMPDLDMNTANANPDRYLSDAETGYPNVTGANKGVILEIRRERAIELNQEGFRFDDLVRWKAGYCIDQSTYGMYFPGPGTYDLSGDGKADVTLYANGAAKPDVTSGITYEIGNEIILSGGDKGYVYYHKNIERTPFDEGRDYLYPIPINERSLNHNLEQNPGWNDGLSF